MSTLKIERDKLYKLRNNLVVRVLATDGVGDCPVVAQYPDGGFSQHYADGGHPHNSDFDIIAEHREPRTVYLNFYRDGSHTSFDDAESAKLRAYDPLLRVVEAAVPFREVMP